MLQLLFSDSVHARFFQLSLLDLSAFLLPIHLRLLLVCILFPLLSELLLPLELALPQIGAIIWIMCETILFIRACKQVVHSDK